MQELQKIFHALIIAEVKESAKMESVNVWTGLEVALAK